MKTATIKFRFTFKGNDTMETSFKGISDFSNEHAISLAWQNMGSDNFDRNLISKTVKIEVIDIDLN